MNLICDKRRFYDIIALSKLRGQRPKLEIKAMNVQVNSNAISNQKVDLIAYTCTD